MSTAAYTNGKIDKAKLLSSRAVETQDVDIPDVGTVTVRGLTRKEVMEVQNKAEGVIDFEKWMLHLGMVEPELTLEEVDQWMSNTLVMEIEQVSNTIAKLSGLSGMADKEAMRRFREGA